LAVAKLYVGQAVYFSGRASMALARKVIFSTWIVSSPVRVRKT